MTMLQITGSVISTLICGVLSSPAFTAFNGQVDTPRGQGDRPRTGAGCVPETVTIQQNVCRLEWEEKCSTQRKKVGESKNELEKRKAK